MALSATRSMVEEAETLNNVTMLDTTHQEREETVARAEQWIRARLGG